MTATWRSQFQKNLEGQYKDDYSRVEAKYKHFSKSYEEEYSVELALNDIYFMEKLSSDNLLEIQLYRVVDEGDDYLHLRLFQWQKSIPLSDILPILENFDLRTESVSPYQIKIDETPGIWISDFALTYPHNNLEIDAIKSLFEDALSNVYLGRVENDGLNKLVLGASLSWHDIIILRTFVKYLLQIGFSFTQIYIEKTLANNAKITKDLVTYFKLKFNPELPKDKRIEQFEEDILNQLDLVTSLDEDRMIRRLLQLINATMRTSFFQTDKGLPKSYMAIKLHSEAIPELPLPKPLYEIFVYSPRFEGIHLRKGKIARGGLRWSLRREDFRTEVLGLMKAQVVKNTVIVPTGAKGGFVLKTLSPSAPRDIVQASVIACYQMFISALLSLTDNLKDGQTVPPLQAICYDEPDPYLVVAADKGTATFSDIANSISQKYEFWLGDAFASGGSVGYDHKKMAITARGTWESIKRHFFELECNLDSQYISVVGIGDMSGDVFGNGMLYSKHIKLLAAFDHRHIFIDPNPNPEIAYSERERLFKLAVSSWEDYNPELISSGGGVFKRTLKAITLTPQMKEFLAVNEENLTPNELICAILKAPVDLLFNGGIGTYVKAQQENSFDVGDRTNDYCRVNGDELRCKVVGEGGNLGLTQKGRVEFALNGGLINTDFIDNSAGVDCSDHEVNLKILLNQEVHRGNLTEDARNELLFSLTDEVAQLVLNDNYEQALVMSFSALSAKKNMDLHIDYIRELENKGIINSKIEFLPNEKELMERKAAGLGLTRPELAVLLAYTKLRLKEDILTSHLTEDSYLMQMIETAFPTAIRSLYSCEMYEHQLKREIIATQLSNNVVNKMGITFIFLMQRETSSSVEEVIRAYIIATNSFETNDLQQTIETLNYKISMVEQYEMLRNIRKLINLSTRWFLREKLQKNDLNETIKYYSKSIKSIEQLVPELMTGMTKKYMETLTIQFVKTNLSTKTAERIATYRAIYTCLNIINVASRITIPLDKIAKIYFHCGARMNLVWFRDQIASDTREGHWHSLTRLTLRDELDIVQRDFTIAILKENHDEIDAKKLIDKWIANNQPIVERWDRFFSLLHSSSHVEYSMYFIAIRELSGLIEV